MLLFPVLLQTEDIHLPVHPGEQQGPVTKQRNMLEVTWEQKWESNSFEKSHSKSGDHLSNLVFLKKKV